MFVIEFWILIRHCIWWLLRSAVFQWENRWNKFGYKSSCFTSFYDWNYLNLVLYFLLIRHFFQKNQHFLNVLPCYSLVKVDVEYPFQIFKPFDFVIFRECHKFSQLSRILNPPLGGWEKVLFLSYDSNKLNPRFD